MRHGECKTVGSKLVAVTVSVDDDGTAQSVSYTHLTLPTILRV